VSLDVESEDVAGVFAYFVGGFGDFDAAGETASTGMDLGFDRDDTAEFFIGGVRVRERDPSPDVRECSYKLMFARCLRALAGKAKEKEAVFMERKQMKRRSAAARLGLNLVKRKGQKHRSVSAPSRFHPSHRMSPWSQRGNIVRFVR